SSTKSHVYWYMPEMEAWFRQLALDSGYQLSRRIHLNAGVYVARREFLIEYYEAAAKYVTEIDLLPAEIKKIHSEGRSMPEFPKGCGNDQMILRFLYPRFRDRLKIDYPGELALR